MYARSAPHDLSLPARDYIPRHFRQGSRVPVHCVRTSNDDGDITPTVCCRRSNALRLGGGGCSNLLGVRVRPRMWSIFNVRKIPGSKNGPFLSFLRHFDTFSMGVSSSLSAKAGPAQIYPGEKV
jgi:hypothetical protein